MNIPSEKVQSEIATWYQQWQPALLHEGLRFGYATAEVEDLLHEFFLELIEKNIDVAEIKNPKAYLSVCFKRKLIDYYRSKNRSKVFYINGTAEISDATELPFDSLEMAEVNTELVESIRKAYNKLPERCKKVIYLKFGEGKTTEEIAGITGLAKRTVYNNLFEGVEILRSYFRNNKSHLKVAALLTLLPFLLVKIF